MSDCYAPRTGGIETQVRDLARAQVRAGHEVHVLTATPGPHGEGGGVVEDDDGVRVHRLGTHMPFGLPVNPAGAGPAMPQVPHSHSMVPGGLLVTSSTTRLTSGTSLVIRDEMCARTSYGTRVQSAVIASSELTGRSTTG